MMSAFPVLPDGLRRSVESHGAAGAAWLAEVPGLVMECAEAWHVDLGYAIDRPGEVLLVRGRGRSGPVVIKIRPPWSDLAPEASVLSAAHGRGYSHLLDVDETRRALLLEGLGQELDVAAVEAREGIAGVADILIKTLQQAWTVPLDAALRSCSPASDLKQTILAHPAPDGIPDCGRAVERALAYADQRLADTDPVREVVVHGDPKPATLRSVQSPRPGAESGYVFIEPNCFRSDREYDLGVLLRDANRVLLSAEDPVVFARRWCAEVAEATGCDAEVIWQWSYVQRVALGLRLSNGPEPLAGRSYLQTATALISRVRG
ncbi:MAG TPA: aminoglycoside phosphotransferase family protein [Propioniciclava tarda]|nr:aminoglycoside phosphotransferase family protein [Propioniciclava tarda]HQA30179.1 aminoglycoside phosphotransferase family protein [Propioniciclava tarda]HQD59887.1 aminoglycoside phosphotransferase family protein [Propioniciclava tarda]